MKHRHMLKRGGKVSPFAGKETAAEEKAESVKEEAKEKKYGGEVGAVEGRKAGGRLDRRARGGSVKEGHGKKAVMSEAHETGGKSPFSSAGGGSADKNPYFKAAGGPVGMKSGGKWIQGAIKHPGSFTKSAKKAGKSVGEFAQEHKHDSGTLGKRARLAITLRGMHHKKG